MGCTFDLDQAVLSVSWDALGRRILVEDGRVPDLDRWYYYDGVNEILETADSGAKLLRWYIHGLSYIDERLMMYAKYDLTGTNVIGTSYYYAIDRMYNVRYLLDSAGAIVESYAYDPYGKPLIRECAGRGDMSGDSVVSAYPDHEYFKYSLNCDSAFDPRADLDDDGDVDNDDETLNYAKEGIWDGTGPTDVKTARSLIGNPYMFQGRPNFVFGSAIGDVDPKFTLNDHRNRFADPMTGRWLTRDPKYYAQLSKTYRDAHGAASSDSLFAAFSSSPAKFFDPDGRDACYLPNSCDETLSRTDCDALGGVGGGYGSSCEGIRGGWLRWNYVGNCYRYAAGDPGRIGEEDAKKPKGLKYTFNCDELIKGAKADGMKDTDKKGNCPPGYTKVAAAVNPSPIVVDKPKRDAKGNIIRDANGEAILDGTAIVNDFHWWVQGKDGTWSDKPGVKISPNGPHNYDGQDGKYSGYNQPCGYLCAPPDMNLD